MCVCTQLLSRVLLFATPWTVATRLLYPWEFLGKNTGVGCHLLLQGVFPTQGSNLHLLCLLHCKQILYHWAIREAPWNICIPCEYPQKSTTAEALNDNEDKITFWGCQMTVSPFPPVLSLCFFLFQCFLQRLVFRVSMAAPTWLCKGPPRQILLPPLLSSQLPNSRSQQWALVDQLANRVDYLDLLPERRRQRFVLPEINNSGYGFAFCKHHHRHTYWSS